MQDSDMTDEWIARQWKNNPCVKLPNGDVRTGPVRLSYAYVTHASPREIAKGNTEKRGAVLLFPKGVDLSVLHNEARAVAKAKWPEAGTPKGPKLFYPIRDQDIDGKGMPGEAERNAGYEKGALRISANANRPVLCVNTKQAPIVEDSKVYSGVWALVTLRCYPFEKDGNKGPTFGLQAVMIIADDQNISGSGPANAAEAFAGVNIEAGDINADAAFGAGGGEVDPFA